MKKTDLPSFLYIMHILLKQTFLPSSNINYTIILKVLDFSST